MITQKYLVLHIWGTYNDPFKDLKGKFTEAEIIDFVGRSKEEKYTNQLLNIILTDVGSSQVSSITDSPIEVEEDEEVDISIEDDYEDVYGDYEVETASATTKAATVKTELVDVTDTTGVINKLIEVFAAK